MKKILSIFAVLVVIVGTGHYVLWNFAMNTLENDFNQMIKNKYKLTGDLSYSLTKFGYPSDIGVKLSDITYTTKDTNIAFVSKGNEGMIISTPFTYPHKDLTVQSANGTYTIKTKLNNDILIEGKLDMSFDFDSIKGEQGKKTEVSSSNINDAYIRIYSPEDDTAIKYDIKSMVSEQKTTVFQDKITSHTDVTVNDVNIEMKTAKNVESVAIESYIIKGGIKDFPVISDELIGEIRNIAMNYQEKSKKIDTIKFKERLKELAMQMTNNKSVIYLDDLTYNFKNLPKFGDLSVNLSTDLSILDGYNINGSAKLKLEGLQTLLDNIVNERKTNGKIGIPPMLQAFVKSGTAEVYAKTNKDNMVVINGIPMIKLPTLDTLIDAIPNVINLGGLK